MSDFDIWEDDADVFGWEEDDTEDVAWENCGDEDCREPILFNELEGIAEEDVDNNKACSLRDECVGGGAGKGSSFEEEWENQVDDLMGWEYLLDLWEGPGRDPSAPRWHGFAVDFSVFRSF